jgi:hypothetical protein
MKAASRAPEVKGRLTGLSLCEQHKDMTTLSSLLSGSSWDKIVRHMREAGKPAPKKPLTVVSFELMDSPESTDTETLAF